jgi:hypothetical protein
VRVFLLCLGARNPFTSDVLGKRAWIAYRCAAVPLKGRREARAAVVAGSGDLHRCGVHMGFVMFKLLLLCKLILAQRCPALVDTTTENPYNVLVYKLQLRVETCLHP